MIKRLNITKSYLIDLPHDELAIKLDKLVNAPFSNHNFFTFGARTDTNKFILIAKWLLIWKPVFDWNYTKLKIELLQVENHSQIIATTKTNPIHLIYLAFLFLIIFFVADYNSIIKSIFVYLFILLVFFCIHRFRKHILISSFENDLQIIKSKIK